VKFFKDNLPGLDWSKSFIKRNPELTERFASNIKCARAGISTEVITEYFDNLAKEVDNVPATHIWNFDETNLTDDPGKKEVIMKKGTKYPERIMNSSKSSISLMYGGNAVGEILPPYVIYEADSLRTTWTEGGPRGT